VADHIDPRHLLDDWPRMPYRELMRRRGPWISDQLRQAMRQAGKVLVWEPDENGWAVLAPVEK
jgi:hypothetical protein